MIKPAFKVIRATPYIALLLSPLLITACSSAPTVEPELAPHVRDKFTSDIKSNGLKLFTYQVWSMKYTALDDTPSAQPKVIRSREQLNKIKKKQRQMAQQEEIWQEQINLGLAKTLEKNQFCHSGYIEIERFIGFERAEIRGECNEGANELAPE